MSRLLIGSCIGLMMLGFGNQSVRGQSSHARPPVTVEEKPDANGWMVRVSFGRDPKAFARAAHAFTLDHAKELADQVAQEYPDRQGDHSVAEIRIEGKEGIGEIQENQGPHLPDWPIVEQNFRMRTQTKSAELDRKLLELKDAYRKAAEPTEELLRHKQPIPAEKEKALQDYYKQFNDKLDELGRDILKDQPVPLPRLRMPQSKNLYEHAKDWADAKRTQYGAEQMAGEQRRVKSDLMKFRDEMVEARKRLMYDREAERNLDSLPKVEQKLEADTAKYESDLSAYRKEQSVADQIAKALNGRLSEIDNSIADNSRLAPPADQFAGKPGGATITGDGSPQVFKVDAQGKPLEKQPNGFPKSFNVDELLKNDEKPFVEPALKVKPLDREAEIKAGVFGKIVDVNKELGGITVQVDPSGSKVEYLGLVPENVKPGDFLKPDTTIGKVRPPSGGSASSEVIIRAWNPKNQIVSPAPILKYARIPPASPGQLRRNTPEVVSPPVPAAEQSPSEPGKYEPSKQLVIDENAARDRTRLDYYDEELGMGILEAKRLMGDKELQRRREAAKKKTEESGLLKAKMKAVDDDLKMAQDKLKSIEKEGEQALTRAKALVEKKKQLDMEDAALKQAKTQLDAQAAQVKGSKDNKQIDAFNQKVSDHNRKVDALKGEFDKFDSDRKMIKDKIDGLQRDRTKAEQNEKMLKQEKEQLEGKLRSEQTEADKLTDQIKQQQETLKSITDEIAKMTEMIKERKAKAKQDPKTRN